MTDMLDKLIFCIRAWLNMKARSTELPYTPEYVSLEVTNVCNFKCEFCPQSEPSHHLKVPKSLLEADVCRLFLTRLRSAGIRTNLIHWTLDGEPFMHKGFARLVEISTDFGFTRNFFSSNGVLCTPKRLLDFPLARARLTIAIDFCSDQGYFEEVRGTPGSWERVRSNISAIIEDDRLSAVRIILTDISSFSHHDPEELDRRFKEMKGLFGASDRLNYRQRTFHNATGFLKGRTRTRGRYHVCPYPWTHLQIASNGDVVPCCRDLRHKTVLGNLREQNVEDVWNGTVMTALRRDLLAGRPNRVAACRGCDLPWDDTKFTLKNLYRTVTGRMQLFNE